MGETWVCGRTLMKKTSGFSDFVSEVFWGGGGGLLMEYKAKYNNWLGTQAVQYTVTNNAATTPGGAKFTNQIGIAYSKQTMSSATDFIWKTFQQTSNADRKNVPKVSLSIDSIDGVAYTANNVIHVSANYIQKYTGNVKTEFTGVMIHEMTHVWQWNGNRQTPRGLIEGIADFVRLKAGYAPGHWVKPGKGDRWDQGYDVTAHFLDYCEGLRSGFVAELNKKMRTGYSGNYFVELLGKTVDQLWSDYKAKYSGNYIVELLGKTVGQLWSDYKTKYNTN